MTLKSITNLSNLIEVYKPIIEVCKQIILIKLDSNQTIKLHINLQMLLYVHNRIVKLKWSLENTKP
jgi:hypothetical protein